MNKMYHKWIIKHNGTKDDVLLSNIKNLKTMFEKGPVTPDHVIRIKSKPLVIESIINKKDTATNQLLPSLIPLNASKTAVIITKTDNILYSAFKNAIAPSAIFFAIFAIFAFPTSFFETDEFLIKTNINAITPAKGIRFM